MGISEEKCAVPRAASNKSCITFHFLKSQKIKEMSFCLALVKRHPMFSRGSRCKISMDFETKFRCK